MQVTEQTLQHLKGKYIKATLLKLELEFGGVVPVNVRKAVLDGLNDFVREVVKTSGTEGENGE